MENLSAALKAKIKKNPTNTILRSSPNFNSIDFSVCNHKCKDNILTENGKKIKLPKEFNGKEIWKEFLAPIYNQGECGSCWAFASTSCLANRFNILSKGKLNIAFSPTKLIICDFQRTSKLITNILSDIEKKPYEKLPFMHFETTAGQQLLQSLEATYGKQKACSGNGLTDAWKFLFFFGTTTLSCQPYKTEKYDISIIQDSNIPSCDSLSGLTADLCFSGQIYSASSHTQDKPARFWRSINFYLVPGTPKDNSSMFNIMAEIYRWGPVTSGIQIYPDFYDFDPKKTIYKWNGKDSQVGGHAIEIVGWGEEDGIKFWWIKNSWGKDWGIDGYFKMARGSNNCQIEENVVSGLPDFFQEWNKNQLKKAFADSLPDTVGAFSFKGNELISIPYKENLQFFTKSRKLIDYGFPTNFSINSEQWMKGVESISSYHKGLTTSLSDRPESIMNGGIDPTTGFSRRSMTIFPGYNFSAPIKSQDLPDFKNFWAKNVKTLKILKTPYHKFKKKHKYKSNCNICTIILGLIFILILALFIKIKRLK